MTIQCLLAPLVFSLTACPRKDAPADTVPARQISPTPADDDERELEHLIEALLVRRQCAGDEAEKPPCRWVADFARGTIPMLPNGAYSLGLLQPLGTAPSDHQDWHQKHIVLATNARGDRLTFFKLTPDTPEEAEELETMGKALFATKEGPGRPRNLDQMIRQHLEGVADDEWFAPKRSPRTVMIAPGRQPGSLSLRTHQDALYLVLLEMAPKAPGSFDRVMTLSVARMAPLESH